MKGCVPWQDGFCRAKKTGERMTLSNTTRGRPRWRVEPHVSERQSQRPVAEQQTGTADVVVIDMADDRQVNVSFAVVVRWKLGQSRA
jgi:hypothetical protein